MMEDIRSQAKGLELLFCVGGLESSDDRGCPLKTHNLEVMCRVDWRQTGKEKQEGHEEVTVPTPHFIPGALRIQDF